MLLAVMPCCPAHIVSCLAICCVALLEQIDDGDDDARKKKITKAKRTHVLHTRCTTATVFCFQSMYVTSCQRMLVAFLLYKRLHHRCRRHIQILGEGNWQLRFLRDLFFACVIFLRLA